MLTLRNELTQYGDSQLVDRHAQRTQRSYSGAFARWKECADQCGFHYTEFSPTTTFLFVCWRRTKRPSMRTGAPCKGTTIEQQLSGIRAELINDGLNPLEYSKWTMPRTNALLASIKSTEVTTYKKALTGHDLRRIVAELPDTYDSAVFKWCVYFMHNTMRRPSEVMPRFTRELWWGDLTFENGCWKPTLTKPYDKTCSYVFNYSKTNQSGLLQTALSWCRCRTNEVCALCAIRRLYRRCPWKPKPTTPLLLLSTGKILDYWTALAMLKRLCIKLGLDPKDYGLHSLRRGGCQDAHEEGHGDALINSQGFWKSNRGRLPYEKSRERIDAEKLKLVQQMSSLKVPKKTKSMTSQTTIDSFFPAEDVRPRCITTTVRSVTKTTTTTTTTTPNFTNMPRFAVTEATTSTQPIPTVIAPPRVTTRAPSKQRKRRQPKLGKPKRKRARTSSKRGAVQNRSRYDL